MILADVPAFYFGTSPNKFFDYIAAGLPVLNNYPVGLPDLSRRTDAGSRSPRVTRLRSLMRWNHSPMTVKRAGRWAATRVYWRESEFDRSMLSERFVSYLERAATR